MADTRKDAPTPTEPRTASAAMADALRAKANADGLLSFADFSEVALFHPQEGYYVRQRKRVGLSPEADFYTATSVGPVFGTLVAEAAATLITPAPADGYTLVEIGAEPSAGAFAHYLNHADTHTTQTADSTKTTRPLQPTDATQPKNVTKATPSLDTTAACQPGAKNTSPFAHILTLPLGQPWQWPQKAVVFANELLDAQPFHRLQLLDGRWREWGVRCDGQGRLSEALLPDLSETVASALAAELPPNLPDGWRLDISLAAEALFARLLQGDWIGAFLLFDYGKNWQDLLTGSPAGTARAYRNHRLHTDLLAHPGEQDLTCHVCWDRLEKIATAHGFSTPRLDRQETFFMRHSAATIARIIEQAPQAFDPDRQALMSLLHPSHLGSKFQVLHATRSFGS